MLLLQVVPSAAALDLDKAGKSIPARMAMIAMTTSNSTRVKARGWRCGVTCQMEISPGLMSPPTEDSGGQEEQRLHQGKKRPEGDTDQPEGQGQEPNDGKKNQGQQGHWPAQHEQNAPKDEKL
jgi:hypothetical protein